MKVGYYGYTATDTKTGDQWLVDLRPLVSRFVAWDAPKRKAELSYNGESLFMLPTMGSVYLFVQARDKEIIKAIQKQKISVRDIHSALNGESVGFASYVLFDKHWFGIGCRVLSPRIGAFASYLQQVMELLRLPYKFTPRALTESLPRKDVQKLQEVGSVTIEMAADNAIGAGILNLVTGGSDPHMADVGSIEVVLRRPRKGRKKHNLLRALKGIVATVPEQGLEGLDARARREATDQMREVFIVGQGGLRDTVRAAKESDIPKEMVRLAAINSILANKLKELRADATLKTAHSAADLHLDWQSSADLG